MYLDSQHLFSDAQALTATAVSTNLIDLGADRNVGIGEPLVVVITCDVAMGGTSPTLIATLQADDNSGFSSAASVIATPSQSSLAAGAQLVLPVPPDALTERYVRLNYTLGGTSPTVTLTAFLQPASMVQNYSSYADGITIS